MIASMDTRPHALAPDAHVALVDALVEQGWYVGKGSSTRPCARRCKASCCTWQPTMRSMKQALGAVSSIYCARIFAATPSTGWTVKAKPSGTISMPWPSCNAR